MGKQRDENALTVIQAKSKITNKDGKTYISLEGKIPPFINNTVIRDANDVKRIKKVVALIRKSLEYKTLMKYIKEKLTYSQGLWMSGLTKDMKGIKFEVHHSPFTLFDICTAVAERQIRKSSDNYTTEFDIGTEVMQLHYKGWVGLVTLTATEHEATHADIAPIHGDNPIGQWSNFVVHYEKYFNADILDKHKRLLDSYSNLNKYNVPEALVQNEVHLSLPSLGPVIKPDIALVDKNMSQTQYVHIDDPVDLGYIEIEENIMPFDPDPLDQIIHCYDY